MARTRELRAIGITTDQTPKNLIIAGWKTTAKSLENSFHDLWFDPRTGIAYTIGQAEAIRLDRSTPSYRFNAKK